MHTTLARTGKLTAAAALALALFAGPPHALAKGKPKPKPTPTPTSQQAYTATLDCGAGPVVVDSGNDLFAPLVDRKTGRRYQPVKWHVKVGAKTIRATKPHWHGGPTTRCSYDDGQAVGTVTVQRPRQRRHG
jgi:hypothetical protein